MTNTLKSVYQSETLFGESSSCHDYELQGFVLLFLGLD
jgi:hypothetical protein